ncbi:unnamed protein product, partial [Rotaria magnacalcarata]
MEWFEGIFDILDDEDENDAYGMNTNLDEEEMFIDDDDDDKK